MLRAARVHLAALAPGSLPAEAIAARAVACLRREVATHPKPGLVSHVDSGAHADMDAALLNRSADTLEPYFADLAEAGGRGAGMDTLRAIGIAAEAAMLASTGGVNTHRGAIFGLGLLAAAAGFRTAGFRDTHGGSRSLGRLVADLWGPAIAAGPIPLHSHGAAAARRYGAGGARLEAMRGFPTLYGLALPALSAAEALRPDHPEAVRVQLCLALIAGVEDTNLLHRGGPAGLAFAQGAARAFLDDGGIGHPDWRARAQALHAAFVARNLSPGGCADLLAMTLFLAEVGP
ncbi:triphosphoribosyl-dephospho-CoA synthase MdcB [Methylobacterium sp. Leaf99]|uniref:triphosphoribosyl-dephospho-CoA synthase MdcB n=1 Tax=Methylobacterium sp. Leaf99 TaxID=1736251 RepID=UPI0007005037|nr:triphosphoribosyl-dephospho-CoA synthase MdcB [Methylobacterium sp. Leaf99]KQP09925.1 triphosphoribosyl-dephospho-CoA synthase MdcB [Methylobacterium sp. Leaf99]